MKFRVERARTDHGYGLGWVVLDDQGDCISQRLTWVEAIDRALYVRWLLK